MSGRAGGASAIYDPTGYLSRPFASADDVDDQARGTVRPSALVALATLFAAAALIWVWQTL